MFFEGNDLPSFFIGSHFVVLVVEILLFSNFAKMYTSVLGDIAFFYCIQLVILMLRFLSVKQF